MSGRKTPRRWTYSQADGTHNLRCAGRWIGTVFRPQSLVGWHFRCVDGRNTEIAGEVHYDFESEAKQALLDHVTNADVLRALGVK